LAPPAVQEVEELEVQVRASQVPCWKFHWQAVSLMQSAWLSWRRRQATVHTPPCMTQFGAPQASKLRVLHASTQIVPFHRQLAFEEQAPFVEYLAEQRVMHRCPAGWVASHRHSG
jgi:hypothetical protein